MTGLDFQEKTLGPAGPYVFRFHHQQKYFSVKHEELVASEKIRLYWGRSLIILFLYLFESQLSTFVYNSGNKIIRLRPQYNLIFSLATNSSCFTLK